MTRLPDNDSALRAAVLARLSLALTAKSQVPQRIALAEQAVAMARRCGDPSTEVGALAAYCDAVSGIEYARARLDAARRGRALAEAAGDQVGLLLALRLGVVALLELGDFATADTEAATYQRAADATGVPLYQWVPPIWRATRAVMRGDIDHARQHIAHADELGRRAGSENAAMMVLSARITVHLAQHTMSELLEDLRPVVGQPWASAASGAWLFHQAGDAAAAATMLSAVTVADIAVDSECAPSLWAAGLVAIELGDLAKVSDAYDALAPYADRWIVDGIGAGVYGVIADALGRFAPHSASRIRHGNG